MIATSNGPPGRAVGLETENGDAGRRLPLRPAKKTQSPLERDDWVDQIPQSDYIRFFRSVNWSASHLGPLKEWCLGLRLHTFTLMADSQAASIYWLVVFLHMTGFAVADVQKGGS
jgi:hypothetical protein